MKTETKEKMGLLEALRNNLYVLYGEAVPYQLFAAVCQ